MVGAPVASQPMQPRVVTGQLERLNNLEPAAGERHNEANMASIDH